MAIDVVACGSPEEIIPAISPVFHYFGVQPTPPDADRFVPFIEPSRAFAARADGAVVGGCASFPFELTVPGGTVRAAGLTVVVELCPHHVAQDAPPPMGRQHADHREPGRGASCAT